VGPIVQILLDAGINVNAPASKEQTSALQAAIGNYHLEIVDRLLDAGAEVNAHDARFGTALSTASRWGRLDVMKNLVERGADYTLGCEKYGQVWP
jgi:ankyrin repeat protein